jgi:hypothetical protein
MKKKIYKEIEIHDFDVPKTVGQFKEFFDLKIQEIPDEHRDTADVRLFSCYDSDTSVIEISWNQEETDQEEQERIQLEIQREEKRKQEQFDLFMKLKTEIQRDRPEMHKAMYEEFKEQIEKGSA